MSSVPAIAPVLEPNEQSPLLPQEERPEGTATSNSEDDDSPLKTEGPPNPWKYAWYTFCAFLAVLILALFIKGWIEADDVDVRSSTPHALI